VLQVKREKGKKYLKPERNESPTGTNRKYWMEILDGKERNMREKARIS